MNYEKIYNAICLRGQTRLLEGYKEVHHILPVSLGGTNEASNLTHLTAREHFLCHYLLTRMYEVNTPPYWKMCKALYMMMKCDRYGNRHIPSSRAYEEARTLYACASSNLQKGVSKGKGTKRPHSAAWTKARKGMKYHLSEESKVAHKERDRQRSINRWGKIYQLDNELNILNTFDHYKDAGIAVNGNPYSILQALKEGHKAASFLWKSEKVEWKVK